MIHTVTKTWSRAGEQITNTVQLTADGEENRDLSVVNGTPVTTNIALDVSGMVGVMISANKNITVDTDGSGQAVLTIPSGKPLQWDDTTVFANPFTIDATNMVVTCTEAGQTATVKIRVLQDSTP